MDNCPKCKKEYVPTPCCPDCGKIPIVEPYMELKDKHIKELKRALETVCSTCVWNDLRILGGSLRCDNCCIQNHFDPRFRWQKKEELK